AIVATVLLLTGLPYQVYLEQVSLLTMLLGPATVALALPLLRTGRALAGSAPAVTAALGVGGVLSIALTVGAPGLFDAGAGAPRVPAVRGGGAPPRWPPPRRASAGVWPGPRGLPPWPRPGWSGGWPPSPAPAARWGCSTAGPTCGGPRSRARSARPAARRSPR